MSERVVSTQLINYIMLIAIVDKYQSAYLPHRSTEIALTFIINDILIYLGNKAPCYLVLLNLSSDFDTRDYNILSIGLNVISINGQIHTWFKYFVSSRTSSVKINSSLSPPYFNIDGVPQGAVFGRIFFIIYIIPIKSIFLIKYPNINYHIYADDLQIYSNFLVLMILV